MSTFISWSGKRSFEVAKALREFLPYLVPGCEPWHSDEDIGAGDDWHKKIHDELKISSFAVICVTPENLGSAWLNYEAGAMSTRITVCPYPLAINKNELQPSPLSRYNAVSSDESGTRKMVDSINATLSRPHDANVIDGLFVKFWPDLKARLEVVSGQPSGQENEARTLDSKVDEALALVQQIASRTAALQPIRGTGIASVIRAFLQTQLEHHGLAAGDYRLEVRPVAEADGYLASFWGTGAFGPLAMSVEPDVTAERLIWLARFAAPKIRLLQPSARQADVPAEALEKAP